MNRSASAMWNGDLKTGSGTISADSGVLSSTQYSFSARFENGTGTNPEELLAAAEAACYSMAFAGNLEKNGTPPTSIDTTAACTVTPQKTGGFKITTIALDTVAIVPGIDNAKFQELANATLEGCPVSKTFHGNVDLTVNAKLG